SDSGLDTLLETLSDGSQIRARASAQFPAATLFGIPEEKLLDFLYENAAPTAVSGLRKIRFAVANRTLFDKASIRIQLELVPKTLEQRPTDTLAQLEKVDPRDISVSLQTEEPVTVTIVKIFSDLHLTMTNNTLRFESGSNTLPPEAADKLRRTADVLRNTSFKQILVDGHADKTGKASFNTTLSKNRAQAVADVLLGAGLNSTTLFVTGYGSARPIDTASTRAAYAKNRRVELTIHGLLDADATQVELDKIWNGGSTK
ncbi:MAG: OmpA family protein, partial [Bdellovibrionota bacterium]